MGRALHRASAARRRVAWFGLHNDACQSSSLAVLRNGLTDGENRVLLETTKYATAKALIRIAVRRIAENRRS